MRFKLLLNLTFLIFIKSLKSKLPKTYEYKFDEEQSLAIYC
jgi:hypothetical protein